MKSKKFKVGKELDDSFAARMRLMFDDGVTEEQFEAVNERYRKAWENLHKVLEA